MKKLLFSLAILALPAFASADQIDIQWQDCVPDGVPNRVFNCTGNSTNNLIFNFSLTVAIPSFTAFTDYLSLYDQTTGGVPRPYPAAGDAPINSFWNYETGGCNRSAPTGIALSVVPGTCTGGYADIVAGDPSGAVTGFAYLKDYPSLSRGLFIIAIANGNPVPLNAGETYFAYQLQMNTRNRPGGPGGTNCVGCIDKVALVANTTTFESQNEGTKTINSIPCATINGADPVAACQATPVRNKTWGSVKALYR